MNLAAHILQVLRQKGTAEVPNLGVFFIQKKNAVVENNKLLPPGFEITFSYQPEFVSDKLSRIAGISQDEIVKQVGEWKAHLKQHGVLHEDGLGEFKQSENRIDFLGESIPESPDYFGLEAITIPQGNPPVEDLKTAGAYRYNNSILWVFLLIIPVLALIYLGISRQDFVFGKKSLTPVTTSTHRIEEDSVKQEMLKKLQFLADSIRTDSLKQDSIKKIVPVAKKWKSNKKYKTKRWRKAKPQRNP